MTLTQLTQLAQPYHTRNEFKKAHPKEYSKILRTTGWRDIAFKHMHWAKGKECSIPKSSLFKTFLDKAITKHGTKFDYTKVVYVNSHTYINIICQEHGIFQQTPEKHLKSTHGCAKCATTKINAKNTHTLSSFIDKATKVHNKKYTYDNTIYLKGYTKVAITCTRHGDFTQTPQAHLQGQTCPKCAGELTSDRIRLDFKDFEERANKLHNNKYTYNEKLYTYCSDKTTITCEVHGEFIQSASNHLNGTGCPACVGINHDIIYIWQVNDTDIYKIGISTSTTSNNRITGCAKDASTITGTVITPTTIVYTKVKEPLKLERKLLDMCKVIPSGIPKNLSGKTEFRVINQQQLSLIKGLIKKEMV